MSVTAGVNGQGLALITTGVEIDMLYIFAVLMAAQ
jgi:hypothetical protein